MFINAIVTNISSNICLFADDTNVFIIVENPDMAAELLTMDLEKIMEWAKRSIVNFNPTKKLFLSHEKQSICLSISLYGHSNHQRSHISKASRRLSS